MQSFSKEPNRNTFQLPFHITESKLELEQWNTINKPDEVLVGLRYNARILTSENKQPNTLKSRNDIW